MENERRRRLQLIGITLTLLLLLGAALAAATLQERGHARPSRRPSAKTYQQLVAENYKVLRPAQSRRLLRWAQAFRRCMATRVPLGEASTLPTRIVMALRGAVTPAMLRLGVRCGTKLGDPPPGSSLQFRKRVVVLYLPKRCLLDRKTLRGES